MFLFMVGLKCHKATVTEGQQYKYKRLIASNLQVINYSILKSVQIATFT